jgi:hypothetical protein
MDLKGDFDIKASWVVDPPRKAPSRERAKSRSRSRNQLQEAGRQAIEDVSLLPPKQKDLSTLLVERLGRLEKTCHSQR